MEEINIYKHYLHTFDEKLKNSDLTPFFSELTVVKFNKGQQYRFARNIPDEIGFIISGLVRSYLIGEDGNEKTINFFPERTYVGDYEAFINQTATPYHFRFLEDTVLVKLPYEPIMKAYLENPLLEKHGRILAEQKLQAQHQRIKSFLTQTAEERYLQFTENHPALFQRVSLTHLCTYLGMERQSLTRIRKKLAKK